MLRSRPLLVLALAAVFGVAGGVVLARISDDNPGPARSPIPLAKTVTARSPAGTLTMAFPAEWSGGRARVNCGTANDVHASTHPVKLRSLVRKIGAGQTCAAELDPRPLPPEGAYVSAAFFQLADVACGEGIPTSPPGSLGDMQMGVPSAATLREFGAGGSYDPFEWRHATWCVPGGYSVRLEVFVGRNATGLVRDQADVVVQALRFDPA